MASKEEALRIADELISQVDALGEYCVLDHQDALPLIKALGGSEVALRCQHGPTLFVYIAALMVRQGFGDAEL